MGMERLRSNGFVRLLEESIGFWQRGQAPLLSAALAYYMVFSLSPLLLLAVSIASLLYGPEAASGQLVIQIGDYLGEEVAGLVQEILANAGQQSSSLLTTLISAGVLLFGASLVFRQLKLVLNMIWDTLPEPRPGFSGILYQIRTYLFSLLFALSIGLLLLLSLTLSTILAALDERILDNWPELARLLGWVEVIGLLLLPALLFAVIFKVLPDVRIAWRDVWLGAAVTALLFAIGTRLLALYFRFSTVTSPQGAAGTLVVVLLWLYYSGQIFLMGAAFTRAYADRYGSRLLPSGVAALVEE